MGDIKRFSLKLYIWVLQTGSWRAAPRK